LKARAIKRNRNIGKKCLEEKGGRQPDRVQAVFTATNLRRRNKNGNGDKHKRLNCSGKVSTDEIIEALVAENGMLTIAAKRLKISFNTLKKYISKDPKVQEAISFIEEHSLDRAEKRLLTMIDEGNTAAVFFYLKCKGKKRGFIESAQQQQLPSMPITFKYQLVLPDHYKHRNDGNLLSHSDADVIDVKALPSGK
jgi:hypothetical protein